MTEIPAEKRRWNARPLLYSVITAIVVFLPIAICQQDLSLFLKLAICGLVILVCVPVLITAAFPKPRRRSLSVLSILGVFLAVFMALSYFDLKSSSMIRDTARWLVLSREYKASVLAQPVPADDELRHVEWDGWGMFAMDTNVYLVFDPTDSLSVAVGARQLGKLKGVPDSVARVRRMESDWYTVQLYTQCGWSVPSC